MKALLVITGRGLGGDAVIALNLIKALEDNGVQCEIALDKSAPGILFKKNGYSWHKISIPQAGGHAATKLSSIKAAFKMLNATFKVRKLIKKLDVDFVVGIIGGGAIVGSVGSKLAKKPAVSLICTPLDSKVCTKFNHCFALPEAPIFRQSNLPNNINKSYFPINPKITQGNGNEALERLKNYDNFDENKKTILFTSGSSIFKKMIDGINNFAEFSDDYNLLLIGHPLHKEYLDNINPNIIYLGYVDWLDDLYDFIDLTVLTDDGLSVEETIACGVPAICLTKVKWGRYHNMEGIFKGAIIESDIDELNSNIIKLLDNINEFKENSKNYAEDIILSNNNLAQNIIKTVK